MKLRHRSLSALRSLGLIGAVGGAFLLGRAILATVYVGGRGENGRAFGDPYDELMFLVAGGWEIFVVSGAMIVIGGALLVCAADRAPSETDGDDSKP